MPTPESPGTNRFRCDTCGRHFNTEQEFIAHRRECVPAFQTAAPENKPKAGLEEGEDRDWVSTP